MRLQHVITAALFLQVQISSQQSTEEHLGTGNTTFQSGNTGNEFYVGFMSNYVREQFRNIPSLILNKSYITIMTTEPSGAVVMIESEQRTSTMRAAPGQPVTVTMSGFKVLSGTDINKGVKIKAEEMKKISVFALNEELYSADAAAVLPCTHFPSVSSYEYYAVSVPRSSYSHSTADSAFLIVACSDNTRVSITPTQTISHPYTQQHTVRAGTTFSVQLRERQTLYIQNREDLTGSRIVSNVPISFFTGHECGNVTADVSECDHLVEQIPPTITWGNQFVVAPTATRTASDIIKIVSSEETTLVKMSCVDSNSRVEKSTITITTAGSFHEMSLASGTHCFIETNKSVLVVQLTPGRSADDRRGDPFMVIVPAMNQYQLNATFVTVRRLSLSFQLYANVFVPSGTNTFTSANILMDGQPMTGTNWVSVPCYDSDQMCGHATTTNITEGEHAIWSSDNETPIGVTVYGLGNRETYAYVGGLKLSLPGLDPDQMPTSHFVLSGSSLCMPCSSVDERRPTRSSVEWTRDEESLQLTERLRIADDGSLCINNAAMTDAGNYTCYMFGDPYPHQLSVIGGIIVEPPSCGSAAKGSRVGVGRDTSYIDSGVEALQVCCRVQGPEGTTVSWFLNGSPINEGASGYTFPENGIRYTGPFTEGCVRYTCQANFSVSLPPVQESAKICFGTDIPPSGVNIAGEKDVMEYSPTSYQCSADGFPAPTIIWTTDRDENTLPPNATDHGNGTLSLSGVTEEDGRRKFCCNVGNEHGQLYTCMTLNILIPPEIDKAALSLPMMVISVPFGVILPQEHTPNVITSTGQDIMIPETYNLRIECPILRANPSPSISWFHGNTTIPARHPQFTVDTDGTLIITNVTRNRDDGVYTCVADSPDVGQDESSSTIIVTVPPQINNSDFLNGPGNCLDLTRGGKSTQRIGEDVCVRAGPSATLTLVCGVVQGVPAPDIQWLKDGEALPKTLSPRFNSENTSSSLTLILPLDASPSSKGEIEGNYSCVATNEAGITTASTYVILFGDIPIQSATTEFMLKQLDVYHQLNQTLSEHFPGVRDGEQHLMFLTTGRVLFYKDFDPGYLYDESEESVLPQTMENMFDLVDIIPDGGSIVFNPHRAPRLQQTYSQLVDLLQAAPSSLSETEEEEIRAYLLDTVVDLGSSSNVTMPRLSLYHLYKNTYYMTVLEVDDLIESQRQTLFDWEFTEWYEHNLNLLNHRKEEALTRWKIFANKEEVEEKLNSMNLTDHSKEIYDALVLLVTNRRESHFKDEKIYYLVKFYPDTWYRRLRKDLKESIYQMQFHLTQLKSEIEILEMTSRYLDSEYKKREVLNALFPSNDRIKKLFCELDEMSFDLEEIVKDFVNMSYACFLSGNPVDCNLYWNLRDHFEEEVLGSYAEFYWYVHTVQAALNHRDFSIPAISSTITDLQTKVHHLQTVINIAIFDLAERKSEESSNERDILSEFNYMPQPMTSGYSFELPPSILGRLLWYLNPETALLVPGELFQEYNLTFNHLNTAATNVSAKVLAVNIHRRWFKAALFGNEHLSLKNPDVMVSPGVIGDFHDVIKNSTYQLPLYPTTLLLATDIQLTVDVPFIFHTLPTLIKLSYDPHVTGGFGPFSFGPPHRASAGDMKFRVGIRDSKISITLPGTQLVGYVCDVVPQYPRQTTLRGRRSTDSLSSNSKSDFNEWLYYKRKTPPILTNPFTNEALSPETNFLPTNIEKPDETGQLKLMIAPTHPANNNEGVGVSAQYSFSTNSSLGYTTTPSH